MQSSSPCYDTVNPPLVQRRGKSDLSNFSLDTFWNRTGLNIAHSRAYPSPPMSGSPPLPSGLNPDSSDRTPGSYGSGSQDAFRATQPDLQKQAELLGQPGRVFAPEQPVQPSYPLFRMDMPAGQLFYQPQPFIMPQSYSQQGPAFPVQGAPPLGSDASDFKNQRKTKGHVASACVPCKKAHLRCDAQRPCSRCVSNGKEDTCIDVQHKKRGRPRLRDEREARYDSMGPSYAHPSSDSSMRRPVSFYGSGETSITTPFADSLQRTGSYRVLKSQGSSSATASGAGPPAPQYLEQAVQNPNMYNIHPSAPRIVQSQEALCAYLNMEMNFIKTSQSFQAALGIPSLPSRRLQDTVIGSDIDKVLRLQRMFEDERREREPNHLPPIYVKHEEDRAIHAIGLGQDDLSQVRIDKPEALTFLGADGRQRFFHVRAGLGKKGSTYFIVILLLPPPPQQQHTAPHQYAREGYPREQQYGFQPPPPQGYMQHSGPPNYAQSQNYQSSINAYPPQANVPPPPNVQQYAQPPRQAYAPQQAQYHAGPPPQHYPSNPQPHVQPQSSIPQQAQFQRPSSQPQFQTPPGEMRSNQGPRQRDLQLPPIRDPRGENSAERAKDDRSGRVDIGGLIDQPDAVRRGG